MPQSASLALVPLVTTTASLGYAVAEFTFLSPFVRAKSIPPEAIGTFWDYALVPAVTPVLAFNGTSTIVGTILWKRLAGGTFGRSLVGWGVIAAAAHFVFVPNVAGIVKDMIYKPATAREGQQRWLRLHMIRTLTTDLPAFALFLAAVYYGV
ncbi:hypothetical protein BDP27DRAFT_1429764 [Rhodocollybia butyracea]|uniref:Uncharacterized protein n=1 Tax=Rhodocollybia butyracea TaxID=206335 RepID=A0A9P5U0N0_9AGAR|nr:hypothetical protein BDP27DRAFT_1429764 [Rhodocollybia butyracea]